MGHCLLASTTGSATGMIWGEATRLQEPAAARCWEQGRGEQPDAEVLCLRHRECSGLPTVSPDFLKTQSCFTLGRQEPRNHEHELPLALM